MVGDIGQVWLRYRAWLREHASSAFENLAPSASDTVLAELQTGLGRTLPLELLELLALNDGQLSSTQCCVLPGLEFLSSQRILKEWRQWEKLREDEGEEGLETFDDYCRSVDGRVLDVYTHAGWLPLFKEGWRADYIGIDLSPAEVGRLGQVINFGRDENEHFAAFPNLVEFLDFWLREALGGRCRLVRLEPEQGAAGGGYWWEHADGNSIDVLRRNASRVPLPDFWQ